MMRINLFAQPVSEDAQPQVAESPSTFQARVFGLAFFGVAAVLSFAWWALGVWQGRLDSQMAVEKAEMNRLAGIAAENNRYETELQELDRRIAAVQALEVNRHGPVAFLVSLQEAVNHTSALNLLSVGPKDGRIVLTGEATTETALADLVSQLQAANGYRDVLLREYHEDDGNGGRVSFKFSLDFLFEPPEQGPTAAPPVNASKPAASVPVERPQSRPETQHG